jgi:mannose-6-phosphate isomerase-like protein (cupin superfamily)
MVDAPDLKSVVPQGTCLFESDRGHHRNENNNKGNAMRKLILLAALIATPALAQPAASPPASVLYASPADVAAALARGKAAATMTPQVLVSVGGSRALLEYRGKPTPASLHETEDELVFVSDGSGTIVIGGSLKDQTRRNPANLSGSGIDGGQTYKMEKGAWFYIPAGVAHYFASQGPDGVAIVSLHVPKAK